MPDAYKIAVDTNHTFLTDGICNQRHRKEAKDIALNASCYLQFLASEGDAARLQPTDTPILSYKLSVIENDSKMNLANISIVGPQTPKDMFKIFQLMGVSCDTLMANAAIQAQIQVFALLSSRYICQA